MMEEFEIEFTYNQYLKMDIEDREQIYFALYALFNNQALAYDISQREVYEVALNKALEDQNFEFCAVLKDFRDYFEDDF
jgi:hypothetical protein